MNLLEDIFPLYTRLVNRCERIAINDLNKVEGLHDFCDPWHPPNMELFHYHRINRLLTERLITLFIQRYTTVSFSAIRHYHDQFSTGKVMVHIRIKDQGCHVNVGVTFPRLMLKRPVWYPDYHRPKNGYWRGTINDISTLQHNGFLQKLSEAFYRYRKDDTLLFYNPQHLKNAVERYLGSLSERDYLNEYYNTRVPEPKDMSDDGTPKVSYGRSFRKLSDEQIKEITKKKPESNLDRDFFTLWTSPSSKHKDEENDR